MAVLVSAGPALADGGDAKRGQYLFDAAGGKGGHTESFTEIPVPAGTAIIVKVHGAGDSDAVERYTLSWSTTPGAAAPAPRRAAPAPSVDDSDDYAAE